MADERFESLGSVIKDASKRSLFGGIASAALGGIGTAIANRVSYGNSMRLMREQMRLANLQQRQSYSNMVQGMAAAGLNPAFNEANPSSPATPSSSFQAQSPDLPAALASGMQLASLVEQVKALKLENKNRDIQNRSDFLDYMNKRSENDAYSQPTFYFLDDGVVKDITEENLRAYKVKHDGQLPDILKSSEFGAKGARIAANDIDEFDTLVKEREGRRARAEAELSSANFDKMLADAKINDKGVIDAFLSMPKEEVNKLRAEISKLGEEAAYQKLVNERYESTSITAIIDKMESPDLSFKEKALALVALFLQSFFDGRR